MAAALLETGLRAYLMDQSAVTDLAPGGIHAGELHEDETSSQARGALVIKGSGGASLSGESYVETDTGRVDLFAFAPTPPEAAQLMAEAALSLKRLRRGVYGGVLIHWVNPAAGRSSDREPVVEWPRAFQPFQAKYALEAVS